MIGQCVGIASETEFITLVPEFKVAATKTDVGIVGSIDCIYWTIFGFS
jgi:hypothetical protein